MNRELEPWEHMLAAVGDGAVVVLEKLAGGKPLAIMLHVWNPETGVVAMTSNLTPEACGEFLQDMAKEHAAGLFSTQRGETRQ